MINLYKKNKKITVSFIVTLMLFMSSSTALAAGSAHLTWNANTDSDLAGYNVYYAINSLPSGTCPAGYTKVEAGNVTSYWIDTLTPGHTYYFQLTAYDNASPANESTCSTSPAGATSKLIDYSSDFNGDHTINGLDFQILRNNYFQNTSTGDTNHDGVVNGLDFQNLRTDYFKSF